jgi:hypothetical protein
LPLHKVEVLLRTLTFIFSWDSGFLYLRNAVGLVFFGTSLYFAVAGIQAHVDEAILKRLQSMSADQGGSLSGAIQWYPYSDASRKLRGRASRYSSIFTRIGAFPARNWTSRPFPPPK